LRSRCLLIGDPAVIRREAARAGAGSGGRVLRELSVLPVSHPGLAALRPGRVSALAGKMAASWIRTGAVMARDGGLGALVTGPVNKEAVALNLPGFTGHTEYIARIAGAPNPVMMLAGPTLRVVPVTRHMPLALVPARLSAKLIADCVVGTAQGLKRWFGVARPRIAVCGLNPHAGDGGLLGKEDSMVVAPAVRMARRRGVLVSGPHPADMVFAAARRGRYDAVVAMYHDQAMIPIKTVEADSAVNATLGLPFLRTSPAHGTAFDIAGKGIADSGSMKAAIVMAVAAAGKR